MAKKLTATTFTDAAFLWQDTTKPLKGKTAYQQEREASANERKREAIRAFFDGPTQNVCYAYWQLVEDDRKLWWQVVEAVYNDEGVERIRMTVNPWLYIGEADGKLAAKQNEINALARDLAEVSHELGATKMTLQLSEDVAFMRQLRGEINALRQQLEDSQLDKAVLRQQLLEVKARAFDLSEQLKDDDRC